MKTNRYFRTLAIAALTATALAATAIRSHAAFVITLDETATGVTINGAGSLLTAGLSRLNGPPGNGGAFFVPNYAELFGTDGAFDEYAASGPSSLGPGQTGFSPTDSSGDIVGLLGSNVVIVPANYVSGSPLAFTSSYDGQTFDSLGFTPGTYTYTLGSGDTLVIGGVASVVPEPGTWAMLALGLGGLGLTLRQRRRAA